MKSSEPEAVVVRTETVKMSHKIIHRLATSPSYTVDRYPCHSRAVGDIPYPALLGSVSAQNVILNCRHFERSFTGNGVVHGWAAIGRAKGGN